MNALRLLTTARNPSQSLMTISTVLNHPSRVIAVAVALGFAKYPYLRMSPLQRTAEKCTYLRRGQSSDRNRTCAFHVRNDL